MTLKIFILILILAVIGLPGCQSKPEYTPSSIKPFVEKTLVDPAAEIPAASAEPDPDGVKLKEVTFAADGVYLQVNFLSPPRVASEWRQGSIYVIDEKTGKVYSVIPTAPVIGPLFAKPQHENQPGYVMLNNFDAGVKSGSLVTVVLGKYKRTHVKVN